MFYIIGLGLSDEKDITLRGLEAIKRSTRVYLEAYTSILMVEKDRLEALYERPLILADREMVETQSDEILARADTEDISLLVVGDPFGATTHTDILLRARALKIPTRVIHNASIMNAIGACGLQLYNFGQTVSLVFFTDTWKPDSFYDRVKENVDLGMHTLVLLDIKVKEQSEENLARGRKIYEPPRYMSIPTAVAQLIETEKTRNEGILSPNSTLAIALSRVGGGEQECIVAGTLKELLNRPAESYGQPLHSLVIVGKRLHHLEVSYAEEFAVNQKSWRDTARDAYGCALE
ncbi:tetrapyrrole methylase [Crepidotus variabilis]|uniref:diphthine methyl ester synthase n=1 Tax=Crepidotus variabilis TaxID=179855 RepID=A0A9P6E7D2_9AGAR|nr:tetrapyrrole methylase [Crepidotus variabilis]